MGRFANVIVCSAARFVRGTTRRTGYITAALVAGVLLLPVAASATVTITLNNSFIDTYANRATISAAVHIDAAATRPHPNSEDGDEHAAGTSSAIGLASVFEIMNANESSETTAVGNLEGSKNRSVSLTGYWRIWPEHGGAGNDFTQGGAVDPITNTNPPHVFEIHPVLTIDGTPVDDSLHPISGYDPKDAETAFQAYERTRCEITSADDANTTTITTDMIGYNYVRFQLRMTSQSTLKATDDGGIEFFVNVEEPDTGDLIATKIRMVVAPGTSLVKAVSSLKLGDALIVWGIPRLDLSLVKYRAAHPDAKDWNLPYEMTLVGVDSSAATN